MRALTLTQPWATLVAIGAKRYETRSWRTDYRGELAIHAAKAMPAYARDVCGDDPFVRTLFFEGIQGPDDLPRAGVVALANLAFIVPTSEVLPEIRDTDEEDFGDFGPRRWAWQLEDVRPIKPAMGPVRGALGLWKPDKELARLIRKAAAR